MADNSAQNGNVDSTVGEVSSSGDQSVSFDNGNRNITLKVISTNASNLHLTINTMATIRALKEIISRKLNLPQQISLLCRGRLLLEGTLRANGVNNNCAMLVSSSKDNDPVQHIIRVAEFTPGPKLIKADGTVVDLINDVAPTRTQPTVGGPIRNLPIIAQNNRSVPYSFIVSAINYATQAAAVLSAIQQSQQYPNMQQSTAGRVGPSMPGTSQAASSQRKPILTLVPQAKILYNVNTGSVQQKPPKNYNIRPNITVKPITPADYIVISAESNANINSLPNRGAKIAAANLPEDETYVIRIIEKDDDNDQAKRFKDEHSTITLYTKSP